MDQADAMKAAEKRAESLSQYAAAMRAEGDHREAEDAEKAASDALFFSIHGITPEAWDEREQEEQDREKRYEILDQNGDRLDWFDNLSHASQFFRNWLPHYSDPSLNRSGIWDREEQTWVATYTAKEDD